MSAGLSGLSNDDLMAQLRAARQASSPAPAPQAAPDLSSLSDDDLMGQLRAARGAPAVASVPSPFDQGGAASFDDRFGSGPTSATLEQASTGDRKALGEGLRRVADERLVGKPSAENAFDAALFSGANAFGFNLPRNMMAAAESVKSGRSFDQAYRYVKDTEDALSRQNPGSSLTGTVAGVAGGAAQLPAFVAKQGAGVFRRGLANLGTGALYGAAGEFADSKSVSEAGKMGIAGGVLGAAGGEAVHRASPYVMAAVEKVAPAFSRLIGRGGAVQTPQGQFTPEAADALRSVGIDPGQIPPAAVDEMRRLFEAKGITPATAREAAASEFGIPLSRGQATQDPRALALEEEALAGGRGSRAQTIGQDFATRQGAAIDSARTGLFGLAARGGPVLDNPTMALEAVADRARLGAVESERQAAAALVRQDAARRGLQPEGGDALDAANAAAEGIRDAAGRSRAAYKAAYDETARIPGNFAPGALDDLGAAVRGSIGTDLPIDPVLTPSAHRALADLDSLPGILNLREGETPTLQQVEQVRKRFGRYYQGTGQNPTDRAALTAVREAFDQRIEDLLAVGRFGSPARAANSAADAFPGDAALTAGAPTPAAGGSSTGPESLVQFLARRGGIRLDDDARAGDLGRIMTRHGPLGRRNGRPIEDFRDELVSEGFIRPDDDTGVISRRIGDEIYDLIGMERAGNPVHRLSDVSGGPVRDAGGRLADQSAAYSERVGSFQRQIADELAGLGVSPREIDPKALEDAAGRLMRREAETGADAYEAAVMARSAEPRGPAAGAADDVPFPGMGEGVGPAASSSLPIGDTAPAEAMRAARGLFQDHKRAFSPRGPGDDAGAALRKILERGAQPTEIATMLFGSMTRPGETGLSLRLADRLLETFGADSPTFAAVRRGLIARTLDGNGSGDIGRRIDTLLTGNGRDAAARILTAEQRRGLEAFRLALRETETSMRTVPGWLSDLSRSGFDPNAIASNLFGAGVPGSRVGAANYARGLKGFLGEDSAEWSGLRQAALQSLTQPGGKALAPGSEADRVLEFLTGRGAGLAREMFTDGERAALRRYAETLRSAVLPSGEAAPKGGRARIVAAQMFNTLAAGLALSKGGPAAAGAVFAAKPGQRLLIGGPGAIGARRGFLGGAPRLPREAPEGAGGRGAVAAALAM